MGNTASSPASGKPGSTPSSSSSSNNNNNNNNNNNTNSHSGSALSISLGEGAQSNAMFLLAGLVLGYMATKVSERISQGEGITSFVARILSKVTSKGNAPDAAASAKSAPAQTECTSQYPETHSLVRPIAGTAPDIIPPEIPGDVFDRQRCVPGFDQMQMENQVVLCLGTGGIGSSVALACVRLGVKRLYLIDFDTIEGSNLNRQILFRKEDVGKPKVYAARDALLRSHNLRTEIHAFYIDAVRDFGRIVALARNSTVIFNNIDFGEAFDYATSALALSLRIPYLAASTYGAGQIEVVLAKNQDPKDPCWSCRETVLNLFSISKTDWELPEVQEIVRKFNQDQTPTYAAPEQLTLAPAPSSDSIKASGESLGLTLTRTIAKILRITHNLPPLKLPAEIRQETYPTSDDPRVCHRPASIEYLYRAVRDADWFRNMFMEIPDPDSPMLTLERVNAILLEYAKRVETLFLPSKVQQLTDIGFLPRLRPFPARLAGSWTGVCVTGSFLLVNQWVQYINARSRLLTVQKAFEEVQRKLAADPTNEELQQLAETKAQELEAVQQCRNHFAEWTMFDISCLHDGSVNVVTAPGEKRPDCPYCADLQSMLARQPSSPPGVNRCTSSTSSKQ